MLLETMAQLGDNKERFAEELIADLNRRHDHVLAGAEPSAEDVIQALGRFAASAKTVSEQEPELDVDTIDLADSLMKTFALVLGRAAWKPQMALEWNAALREEGERLLAALRETGS